MAYRVYISDSLFLYARNKTKGSRYYDVINPKRVDNKTAEEIVNDVVSRAGLKIEGGEVEYGAF